MKTFTLSYGFWAATIFAIIIVCASLAAPPSYDIKKNTISELGSQLYERKLIMQTGFVLFGGILVVGSLIHMMRDKVYWWVIAPVVVYGFSILMTGIFCAAPFQGQAVFSQGEANLHSSFAQLAGMAFCLMILSQFFITDVPGYKMIHIIVLCLVIALSALFGLFSEYSGLTQRLMYLVSLLWLAFFY